MWMPSFAFESKKLTPRKFDEARGFKVKYV